MELNEKCLLLSKLGQIPDFSPSELLGSLLIGAVAFFQEKKYLRVYLARGHPSFTQGQ
jgi:hypothetical protein